MSYPHTEDVVSGLKTSKPDVDSAITLLRQYKTLCTTQESQISTLQNQVSSLQAELSQLNAEMQVLKADLNLPSVKAAKLAEAQAKFDAAKYEILSLGGTVKADDKV